MLQANLDKGMLIGTNIRSLMLRHSVDSNKADSLWRVRGGEDLVFSVWDDDVPGVSRLLPSKKLIALASTGGDVQGCLLYGKTHSAGSRGRGGAPQVHWSTKPDGLIESNTFRLAFQLKSRPAADVKLHLRCEKAEVVSYWRKQMSGKQEAATGAADASEVLEDIFITPDSWRDEHSFLLRLVNTGKAK